MKIEVGLKCKPVEAISHIHVYGKYLPQIKEPYYYCAKGEIVEIVGVRDYEIEVKFPTGYRCLFYIDDIEKLFEEIKDEN